MNRAFVTGASSFIGIRLCQQLLQAGMEVHAFCREPLTETPIVWHQGNIRDGAALLALIGTVQPRFIFHLAADTRRTRDLALLPELFQTNVVGTFNIVEAARLTSPAAVVGVGSFEEYGDNLPPFREDMQPRPVSPYGITKTLASLMLAGAGRTVVPATVLRFSVPYGPGQTTDSFIGDAINALQTGRQFQMTQGEQTRDFLYVDDAVAALLCAANQIDRCRGEILNACSGQAVTLAAAAKMIGEIAQKPDFAQIGALPYRPRELMQYVGDPAKIADLLGWRPRISFADGIRQTLGER